jgi:tol-pal system protein YbgF
MLRLRAWPATASLLAGLLAAAPAAAFLNDAEARKAINDLRDKVTAMEEAAARREAESASAAVAERARQAEELAVLRRSLLELNNQIVALRTEIARLSGANETLARELAESQRRQRDLAQAFDERLKLIEPVKVAIDGREFMVEQGERRAYEEAFAAIRGGDFERAAALFTGFLRRYPGGPYADTARFWLANAHYGRRDHRQAIELFRAFVTSAPQHPRAPEALLALANSQAETKDARGARRTIEELLKAYPSSEAAAAGKDRLASLPR